MKNKMERQERDRLHGISLIICKAKVKMKGTGELFQFLLYLKNIINSWKKDFSLFTFKVDLCVFMKILMDSNHYL